MIHGLIYSYFPNFAGEFTNTDKDDNFKLNQKTQPIDWEYNTKKIFYSYNNYGHRSVEVDQLGDNYILTTGCSITEGVGLAIEDTWSHIVAKHLGQNYYNLAVGGSGPYVVCRNIITFLSSKEIDKHPNSIIIQWPFFARFFRVQKGIHLSHLCPASIESQEYYSALLKENDAFYINVFERRSLFAFLKNINYTGKIVEMFRQNFEEVNLINYFPIEYINSIQVNRPDDVDFARDLGHPGSKSHKLYADRILTVL
jgi:hypothetical protein